MTSAPPPKKIAILGGGISSITVALLLTEDKNWQEYFDVTIYQLGWRLGGKGATGRGEHDRIEEHGLHVWLGFYENAFRLMRKVYDELGRSKDVPISTLADAFSGHDYIGVANDHAGQWHPCLFDTPHRDGIPGRGDPPAGIVDCRNEALKWLYEMTMKYFPEGDVVNVLEKIRPYIIFVTTARSDTQWPASLSDDDLIQSLGQLADLLDNKLSAEDSGGLGWRCIGLFLMTVAIIVAGLLKDQINTSFDLERLENIDFAEWLHQHRAPARVSNFRRNPYLRGLHDFAFAYLDGDTNKPLFSASPALRTIYRMCLTYKGSIFYKMEGGMGDTIFAPAYEVLKKRKVKFKFFHRVKNLGLSNDKKRIETIDFGIQATLQPGVTEYVPLIPVKSANHALPLPCWPAQPRYEQLKEGDDLRNRQVDLESFWTDWQDPASCTLSYQTDFHIVVFGISLGSVRFLCKELLAASGQWRDMVTHIKTVNTQAAQFWLKPSLRNLGWRDKGPVLDAWIQPLNTWADMTNLLHHGRENWPANGEPKSLAYFCGPLPSPEPDPFKVDWPNIARKIVDRNARQLLKDLKTLWQKVGPGGIPDSDIVSSFIKPNIDPSERYVLSIPGSAKYRLETNGTGFDNLLITGDWIQTRYNAGCIEAATWAGIRTTNAIFGRNLDAGIYY